MKYSCQARILETSKIVCSVGMPELLALLIALYKGYYRPFKSVDLIFLNNSARLV